MTDHPSPASIPEVPEDDHFQIGEDDLLAVACSNEALEDIQIRIGTLLKTENVSFLLGAGASVESGGITIGSLPVSIERALHKEGISDDVPPVVYPWLSLFYLAAQWAGGGDNVPTASKDILKRCEQIADVEVKDGRIPVNLESVISILHRWRAALPQNAERLCVDGEPRVEARVQDLDECLAHAKSTLAQHCVLPKNEKEAGLSTYKALVRKILTRPLNLKRVNLFTLNYDTLVEQAADAEGVVLLDGFVGTTRRVFRPECYEHDLYFPAETTEGRVHRFDRVLHLYKLHGSITWVAESPTLENPYGVAATSFDVQDTDRLLIYPTPAKFAEMLGMPYAELFRRFAATITRPQSVLFVVGYGFGDEHVNAIIRQALAVPSFTLVVVDPHPNSQFVSALRKQNDRRVWIAQGKRIGTFAEFVNRLLPDLRDEEIRKKVMDTHKALGRKLDSGDGANVD